MAERPRPYIGITGFMGGGEVDYLLNRTPRELLAYRDMMVGVLVSSKTMHGVSNKWPGRYPPVDEIPGIFNKSSDRLNLLHFSTDYPERLSDDMCELMHRAGRHCCGFQLNVRWPDVREIAKFRDQFPRARLVLQLGAKALDEVEWDEDKAFRRVRDYIGPNGPVTDILFDPSGGEGIYRGPKEAIPFLRAVMTRNESPVGLGFAGGLSVAKLPELCELMRQIPHLSLDAEGQLRRPLDDPANNSLDKVEAFLYFTGALSYFARLKESAAPTPA